MYLEWQVVPSWLSRERIIFLVELLSALKHDKSASYDGHNQWLFMRIDCRNRIKDLLIIVRKCWSDLLQVYNISVLGTKSLLSHESQKSCNSLEESWESEPHTCLFALSKDSDWLFSDHDQPTNYNKMHILSECDRPWQACTHMALQQPFGVCVC